MLDYKDVGRRVRYFRRKRGITQEQLAFEVNTSAAYLSNIERAVKKPSLQKLLQIADALDISIEDLISSTEDSQYKPPDTFEKLVHMCSESDRKRLVNNLFEIISILEKSS